MITTPIRIALISGTSREVIKLVPVYQALMRQHWAKVEWIHTGQDGEMADQIFRCFDVDPQIRLERVGERIEEFSGRCREQLDQVLRSRAYDFCIIQGDTESAFVGAIGALYRHIPLGHVEAGLRTYKLERPFPKEAIRRMISQIADLHLAPTGRACSALMSEGIAPEQIILTGNTVIDAQHWAAKARGISRRVNGEGHILVTIHRREHWGTDMEAIFRGVVQIARERRSQHVLFPVHLDPIVRESAQSILSRIGNVRLCEPLHYLEMQQALADAAIVLTDSGGLQEEAPTYQVPVLVLRHETERPEAVEAGFATVVGPHPEQMVSRTREILGDREYLDGLKRRGNPYGDGHAAQRITLAIAARFGVAVANAVIASPARARQPLSHTMPQLHSGLGAVAIG